MGLQELKNKGNNMTDTVRWNGHKGHKLTIQFDKIEPTKLESSFFASLRKLDAELESKKRSATEDEFLKSMRDYLDELEKHVDDESQK